LSINVQGKCRAVYEADHVCCGYNMKKTADQAVFNYATVRRIIKNMSGADV
jgi:hypothetical protein